MDNSGDDHGGLTLDPGAGRVVFGPGTEGEALLRRHAGPEAVRVTFRYSEDDLRRAMRFHASQRLTTTHSLLRFVALGLCLSLLLSAGPVLLAYLLCGPLLVLLAVRRQAQRMLVNDRAWRDEHRWVVSEDGIYTERPDAEGRLGWGAITKVVESPEGFLVFPQHNVFHLLPKRCVSQEDQERLREIFAANTEFSGR